MKKVDMEEFIKAFDETVFMTIRYAHNRQTFAPTMVRRLLELRAKLSDFSLHHRDTTLRPPSKDWINPFACPSDDLRDLYDKYGGDNELSEYLSKEDDLYLQEKIYEYKHYYKSKNGIKHAIREIENTYESPEVRMKKTLRVMALRKLLDELDE